MSADMVISRFAVFLMAAVFQSQVNFTASADAPCPPNSHRSQAGLCGLACNRVADPHMPCQKIEKLDGCACDSGFIPQKNTLTNSELVCVRPEKCKVKCPDDMHYEPYASNCQPTCKNPKVPKPCNVPCSPQCVCNDGYILIQNTKKCVKPHDCPK